MAEGADADDVHALGLERVDEQLDVVGRRVGRLDVEDEATTAVLAQEVDRDVGRGLGVGGGRGLLHRGHAIALGSAAGLGRTAAVHRDRLAEQLEPLAAALGVLHVVAAVADDLVLLAGGGALHHRGPEVTVGDLHLGQIGRRLGIEPHVPLLRHHLGRLGIGLAGLLAALLERLALAVGREDRVVLEGEHHLLHVGDRRDLLVLGRPQRAEDLVPQRVLHERAGRTHHRAVGVGLRRGIGEAGDGVGARPHPGVAAEVAGARTARGLGLVAVGDDDVVGGRVILFGAVQLVGVGHRGA